MNNIDIVKIEDWGFGLSTPLMIAGPCSAESLEQIDSISKGLKGAKIDMFRAGIWKPRTRPGSFEGVGKKGLEWLKIAKENLGVPVTVEVANAKHTEEALEAGIDVLWIGARTTVNPFSVQEICDALKGVDIPVMVKNPINPDLQLWLGAVERLYQVGIKKIAAVHRGFSNRYVTKYRNSPEWSLPLRLKEMVPGIQIICDPSHICGNRDCIPGISQKALDFGLDGLMIETHHDPDKAWSDAKQQLTPETYTEMIKQLTIRKSIDSAPELKADLSRLREHVDQMDKQLVEILGERFKYIQAIGQYKRENNLAVFQGDRWKDVTESRINMGKEKNLSEHFMKELMMAIHEESIKKQQMMLEKNQQNSDD
ncbi:MAG: bifunctional 3-deoxy-7-phosphoheptulonate synthase/chorismate mutase type II [Cyclobacteriaceae bacterium]|nr:bifunctional 3-deoxy-7-phosphoheptulonate synthase/chorismate mutase type II [Cyclobacteriaceae bacterium]